MVVGRVNIHIICVVTNTENNKKILNIRMNVMNMIIKYNLLII